MAEVFSIPTSTVEAYMATQAQLDTLLVSARDNFYNKQAAIPGVLIMAFLAGSDQNRIFLQSAVDESRAGA